MESREHWFQQLKPEMDSGHYNDYHCYCCRSHCIYMNSSPASARVAQCHEDQGLKHDLRQLPNFPRMNWFPVEPLLKRSFSILIRAIL